MVKLDKIEQIYIIGPTASGKTDLAIRIAQQYDGEIIAADSRTVFRGLDIGTAKPTKAEQTLARHWALDIVGPDDEFSAAKFQNYAKTKIAEIQKRRKTPIIVGGSGLYIDALLYDFTFSTPDKDRRDVLQARSIMELQQMIRDKKLTMPENDTNKRYLINALERAGQEITKREIPSSYLIIGLNPSRRLLKERITKRAHQMLKDGVIDEIRWAYENYDYNSEALKGGIYKIFRGFIQNELSEDRALDLFIESDLKLVKKQLTWFKRNKRINWFEDSESALEFIQRKLQKTS